ncbi:MAG: hypothetical protein QOH56_1699, partial [Pseudonocardiales bacterium]|nr:hypothetical protein [Pseudonocardiales bacterium]
RRAKRQLAAESARIDDNVASTIDPIPQSLPTRTPDTDQTWSDDLP